MSRLSEALLKLCKKCTKLGKTPNGDNADEIVECMANHFEGNCMVVTVTSNEGVYTADRTFAEIKSAADSGKVIRCLCNGSYYDMVSCSNAVARFSRVMHSLTSDSSAIANMGLYVVEISSTNNIVYLGKAIS